MYSEDFAEICRLIGEFGKYLEIVRFEKRVAFRLFESRHDDGDEVTAEVLRTKRDTDCMYVKDDRDGYDLNDSHATIAQRLYPLDDLKKVARGGVLGSTVVVDIEVNGLLRLQYATPMGRLSVFCAPYNPPPPPSPLPPPPSPPKVVVCGACGKTSFEKCEAVS